VVTAVYILNRSPTKTLNGKMPYEAWHGRKPAVSLLRVFGCLAFSNELSHIGKLDDRSTLGVFIGYAKGSKAYRILHPGTQRVHTTHDVVFDEGRGWTWDKAMDDGSTPTYDNFTIEYVHFEGAGGVGSSLPPSMSTPVPEPPPTSALRCPATTSAATMSSLPPPQPVPPCTPTMTATPPGTSTPAPAHVEPSPVEFATPLSHDEEHLDACYDGEPLRYHTMEDLLGDQPVPRLVPHDLEGYLVSDNGEPQSFAEAEKDVAWRAARRTTPGSLLISLVVTARSPLSGCSSCRGMKSAPSSSTRLAWWREVSCSGRESTSTMPSLPWHGWSPCDSSLRWLPRRVGVSTT
jgi:hypothetical protein